MASILKQRRDTAANWTSANPVIPDGQLCFDTTNNTFRIGDGTTVHDSLPIQSGVAGASGGLQDIVEDLTPQLGGNLDLNGNDITGTGDIPSANLSGALPAIDGSALTGLPAAGADTALSNLSATGENKVCQAWVNFDGTGTVAISDSYNVSSITDRGTGQYTVNFASALNNGNYAVGGTSGNGGSSTTTSGRSLNKDGDWTTSSARIRVCTGTSSTDDGVVGTLFFGN